MCLFSLTSTSRPACTTPKGINPLDQGLRFFNLISKHPAPVELYHPGILLLLRLLCSRARLAIFLLNKLLLISENFWALQFFFRRHFRPKYCKVFAVSKMIWTKFEFKFGANVRLSLWSVYTESCIPSSECKPQKLLINGGRSRTLMQPPFIISWTARNTALLRKSTTSVHKSSPAHSKFPLHRLLPNGPSQTDITARCWMVEGTNRAQIFYWNQLRNQKTPGMPLLQVAGRLLLTLQ